MVKQLKDILNFWRHNNIVNYVLQCLDPTKYKIYSDLPGHTIGAGSVPPDVCITTQKPDIVILDEKVKTMQIFELSVPFEQNIELRHTDKSNKYATLQLTVLDTTVVSQPLK